jgi:hypothetical protein
MDAPNKQRGDDEIVSEALKVIKPPADQCEAIRTKVIKHVDSLRRFAKADLPPRGEIEKRLTDYLRNLRASKRTFVHLPYFWDFTWPEHRQFLTLLDAEIDRIKQEHDSIQVAKGSKQRDRIADVAVQFAMALLDPEQLTLTTKGPWHRVAALLYEAVTGKPDVTHVLNYMREIKHGLKKANSAPPAAV